MNGGTSRRSSTYLALILTGSFGGSSQRAWALAARNGAIPPYGAPEISEEAWHANFFVHDFCSVASYLLFPLLLAGILFLRGYLGVLGFLPWLPFPSPCLLFCCSPLPVASTILAFCRGVRAFRVAPAATP